MFRRTLLILILELLVLTVPTWQKKINYMTSSISNPSLLSLCEGRQALVIAGESKLEVFSNLQDKYTKQSVIVRRGPITRIKCLKQGFIAYATKTDFCILDMTSSSSPKCIKYQGKAHSIAQQPDSNLTFLLIEENSLVLSQIQTVDYGASFNKLYLPFYFQRNIALASYVANRQYVYIADQINNLLLYRNPFGRFEPSSMSIDDIRSIQEIKGSGSINSALLTDLNGNFALIKEEQEVGSWTQTPYQHGCLCTKEMFVLANNKNLAKNDLEEIKFINGLGITELADISCVSDGQAHTIYLLDGSGKVVAVNTDDTGGSGIFTFIVIVAMIVITYLIFKYVWLAPKQSQITDIEEAARQDQQNAYRQLKQLKEKQGIQ